LSKLSKSEILRDKKQIEELFSQGETFNAFPLKVVYLLKPQPEECRHHKALITVPKKNFKKAVHRNKLKRRIREAYRHNKYVLNKPIADFYLLIGYIYIGKQIESYQLIAEKLKQSLQRLTKVVGSKSILK
jgi:ribonuclease P protein component